MAYTPDWEALAGALQRVKATGATEDEARRDVCLALSDQKFGSKSESQIPKPACEAALAPAEAVVDWASVGRGELLFGFRNGKPADCLNKAV